MRVFITGASGFIGRALCERYAADGHEVRGCDLVGDPARQVAAGDVAQPGPWQDCAAGSELVIHTAATVSLRLERRDDIWRSYPDSKIAAEQVVLQAHLDDRVQCTVVRPGDVYGPRSRAWATVPAELIRQRRFVLPGLGRGIHSPVFIDNLVDGVVLAAASPDAAGQVFTLSDGIGVPYREFFAPYAELIGRRLVLLPTPVALGAAAVAQRVARLQPGDNEVNPGSARYLLRRGTYSIEKARKVLGWEPRVGLQVGLQRTVGWLGEQGLGAR